MNVLILGASGQVGSEIKSQLIEISNNSNLPKITIVEYTRSNIDFSQKIDFEKKLGDLNLNWIINAAAYTAVDQAELESNLASQINNEAVVSLAKFCKFKNINLLHISTDYVFDGKSILPLNEDADELPLNIYGQTKLAGENAIRKKLPCHIILRTSWVFGYSGNNFVKTIIKAAKERDEINIIHDQIGSPTSAQSIAVTIAFILIKMSNSGDDDSRWGTYHFSGLPYVSWADFAKEIFNQAYKKGILKKIPKIQKILTADFDAIAKRPASSCLDCKKIKKTFNIEPDDWQSSLSALLDDLKGDSQS